MRYLVILGLLLNGSLLYAKMPSGKEILERVDDNYTAENRVSTSTMVIKERRGTRTVKARSWTKGKDTAFTEYLYPPREMGTKMLKIKDELWIYSPATDRTIKIAGHMLRQSLMGSDVSYEDFMEDPVLSNIYEVEVSGEEEIGGRSCYVLGLRAKTEKVTYYSRKLWVDKERYLPLKEERFARSGKLLKRVTINSIFKVDNRWYPKEMTFEDVLKKGSGTEFIIDSIEFNIKVPEHIFSKASLRK